VTRRVALVLLTAVLLAVVLPTAGAPAQSDPATTTTVPETSAGGTSPWVLVLIGAAAGAVVGTFTGLARRRRAERERGSPPRPGQPGR